MNFLSTQHLDLDEFPVASIGTSCNKLSCACPYKIQLMAIACGRSLEAEDSVGLLHINLYMHCCISCRQRTSLTSLTYTHLCPASKNNILTLLTTYSPAVQWNLLLLGRPRQALKAQSSSQAFGLIGTSRNRIRTIDLRQ